MSNLGQDIIKAVGDDELDDVEIGRRLNKMGYKALSLSLDNGVKEAIWQLVSRGELDFTPDRKIRRAGNGEVLESL